MHQKENCVCTRKVDHRDLIHRVADRVSALVLSTSRMWKDDDDTCVGKGIGSNRT